jgi:hypothetical protein
MGSSRSRPWRRRSFCSRNSSFSWAKHVGTTGRVALLIEGDDGTRLTKHEIASALRYREGKAGTAQDQT